MNHAIAEPSVKTLRKPNSAKTNIIGVNHHFLWALRKSQNSNNIESFDIFSSVDSSSMCNRWDVTEEYLIKSYHSKAFSWTVVQFVYSYIGLLIVDKYFKPIFFNSILAYEANVDFPTPNIPVLQNIHVFLYISISIS